MLNKLTKTEQNRVSRAIDANLNRLREGLRVCEDIVRFIADDARLTQDFKKLRFKIRRATARLGVKKPEILKFRNASIDVGKKDFPEKTKLRYSNYQDLLIANMQRAQEALRSLEEFCKIDKRAASQKFKNIRFSLYSLEKDIFEKNKS